MKVEQKKSSSNQSQIVVNPLTKWLSPNECYALKGSKQEETKH
jgi:hypothetical protein